jgi:hypothetical protein
MFRPKSIPNLILVLESKFLGDVGCVSLTDSELEEAKSAPRADEGMYINDIETV